MAWYDLFSAFYDSTVELIYRPYRAGVVEALQLKGGESVLDLACGTGPNHPHLVSATPDGGSIFGVDFSEGMLTRAQQQVQRHGWTNVFLLQRDARELTLADPETACGAPVQLSHVDRSQGGDEL
jgi:ubiquinone/menaquinone biosynthesis C-methylase UbiE